MGEITTLSVATSGKGSLRTTVPMSILKQFKLKAGDQLDWEFEVKNNSLVITVKPIKRFSIEKIAANSIEQAIEQ